VCTGTHDCGDGFFIQNLVRNKFWTYSRLSLDGLKTTVFQENSPSLCVASGNVWFDYPHLNNVGCISHKTLYLLSQKDTPKSAFDWQSFHDSERLCLRLSNLGFTSRVNAARKAAIVATKNKGSNRRLDEAAIAPPPPAVAGPVAPVPVPLPEDFNWRDYLTQNPDLQADGIIFKAAAIEHYQLFGAKEGRGYHETVVEADNFDWRAYLELNPDVPPTRRTEPGASAHYKNIGKFDNRLISHATPESYSWQSATEKLETYVKKMNKDKKKIESRNLVIYHVEDLSHSENSLDVVLNNLRVFVTSIAHHSGSGNTQAFYLFNIVSPFENPLLSELPTGRSNVATVKWAASSSDLYTHLRTLTLLDPQVVGNFSAVFFTSSGVRGPMVFNKNGEWINEFRSVLNGNDIGMAGPTISCRTQPHVQTHFFALRSAVVPHILTEVQRYNALTTPWKSTLDYFSTEMSASVLRAGYQIGSRLTQGRLKQQQFSLNCTANNNEFSIPFSQNWDFRSWCDVQPQEAIFLRWGGEAVSGRTDDRYLCGKEIDMSDHAVVRMEDTMLDVASASSQVQFLLPESPYGGLLYDLFKQYRDEMWRERLNHMAVTDFRSAARVNKAIATSGEDENVCFLVRTSTRDDPMRAVRSKPEMKDMDLASLIQCKLCVITARFGRLHVYSLFTFFSPPSTAATDEQEVAGLLLRHGPGALREPPAPHSVLLRGP